GFSCLDQSVSLDTVDYGNFKQIQLFTNLHSNLQTYMLLLASSHNFSISYVWRSPRLSSGPTAFYFSIHLCSCCRLFTYGQLLLLC
uniref:Uncharacterized protein n=1 Tax=Amphiprion percula TaxID=161767 RepID=A0A3P8SS16_AMPPE